MLSPFSDVLLEVKITLLSVLGVWSVLADISGEVKTWEEIGFKAFLMALLFFLGKEYLKQQRDHKQEMRDTWAQHEIKIDKVMLANKAESDRREAEMLLAIQDNSEKSSILIGLTKEQTDYFKAVTRNIIDERLKKPRPQIDTATPLP